MKIEALQGLTPRIKVNRYGLRTLVALTYIWNVIGIWELSSHKDPLALCRRKIATSEPLVSINNFKNQGKNVICIWSRATHFIVGKCDILQSALSRDLKAFLLGRLLIFLLEAT